MTNRKEQKGKWETRMYNIEGDLIIKRIYMETREEV